jgi:hypothetical protein
MADQLDPLSTLSEEDRAVLNKLTEEQKLALLSDRRRKTIAPEGIIPGTNAYHRWYREQNREKVRLYQRRAYLKRRRLSIAFDRVAERGTRIDDELKEIDAAISSITEMRKAEAIPVPPTPLTLLEGQIPFVAEEANRLCISYDDCLSFMQSPDYRGEDSWQSDSGRKLLDIFRLAAKEKKDQ